MHASERQLTHAPYGHVLTNINVWSPDSRFIVYDVRSVDSVFDGTRVEQVLVTEDDSKMHSVEELYTAKNGAACGVVTYHPREPKVIFIHGPENPTTEWSYGASRRRGVILEVSGFFNEPRPLDAMTYAPPFRAGALRGGTHVHVFSPDGAWVSSTYEDEVLARLGAEGGHERNQRNIAVAVPVRGGVKVGREHPRNHDGDYFSVVVTRTVNRPKPGSDEISRAFEEGWVVDGPGRRSLAFLGNVTAPDGREHAEVFLVDLPADLTNPGEAPLEGTATTRPAPPRGVAQRRLTFTTGRKYPGVVTAPRHWVRSSPDGAQLAFLMKDDVGVVQLWAMPARGGEPRQVTRGASGISSAFTWSPDGAQIAHTMDGSVCVTRVETGDTRRLTEARSGTDAPEPLACVFSPDGKQIAYTRRVAGKGGTFAQVFVVDAGTGSEARS
ncbi:MAG: DUF3748 domain-containing protein [Verrucomicrobiota bacterium]